MKFNKSLTALVILGASVDAPVANAQDNILQSIVSRVLSTALEVTAGELQQQATLSVANAAEHVTLDSAEILANTNASEDTSEHVASEHESPAKALTKKSFKSE